MMNERIRCAVVGYGATFNFGWMHARWIQAVPDLKLVAICDQNPACAEKAKNDFPDVDADTDLRAMLGRDDVDMVSVVTPHNTHAPLVIDCLNAGKHVVVDKPMCPSIAEATEMIETARKANRTLAVFHNRRHDGNVRAIKEVIEQGRIGDVFHVELSACGYGRPGNWWRSRKEISGGALYDWGSHASSRCWKPLRGRRKAGGRRMCRMKLEATREFGNVIYEVANETGGARWVAHFVEFIHRRLPGALVSAGEQSSSYDPVMGRCDLVVKHRGKGGDYRTDEDVARHRASLMRFRQSGKPVLHNEFKSYAVEHIRRGSHPSPHAERRG